MLEYKKPKKLKKTSKIAIVSLSGVVKDMGPIERAQIFFNNLGYDVELSESLTYKNRYMAGYDEERVEELHHYFSRDDIDGIICSRGGYGALRLINLIDYDLIKNNPKVFAGYSDISILSAMFLKKAGLITYSAPMASGDFGAEEVSQFTVDNFFKAVSTNDDLIFKADKFYKSGSAEGRMFGGNLASIVSLCGQDFIPDEDFIFFAEDVSEPVYKIDKMFTQLLNITKFKRNMKGLILGEFTNTDNQEWLEELFQEFAQNINIPIYSGFKITHEKDKITIPYGQKAKMENGILTIFGN